MFSPVFIESWIQGILDAPQIKAGYADVAPTIITPPPSSASEVTGRYKRKAREAESASSMSRRDEGVDTSHQETPAQPAKRARRGGAVPASSYSSQSSFSFPNSSAAFLPPESPILRSSSPKRDLMNQLRGANPRIDWMPLPRSRADLSEDVKSLILNLSKDFDVGIIPTQLREKLNEVDPWGASSIRPSAFTNDTHLASEDADEVWDFVEHISTVAETQHMQGGDENAWCDQIVRPILARAASGAGGQKLLMVENIQSQAIEPHFHPIMPSNIPLNKKADYAWSFSPYHIAVKKYYSALSRCGRPVTLSPMKDPRTSKISLFFGVEVKRSGSGEFEEAIAQLSTWSAATLRKNMELTQSGKKLAQERYMARQLKQQLRMAPNPLPTFSSPKDNPPFSSLPELRTQQTPISAAEQTTSLPLSPTLQVATIAPSSLLLSASLPIPGLIVRGHDWRFYLSWLPDANQPHAVIVSLPMLNTSTDTYFGIFKILNILRRLAAYGSETYWPWVEKEILQPSCSGEETG